MSFAITILSLAACGYAILRLSRLRTGSAPADVALAWLVGSGAFALAAPLVRFGFGVPLSRATVVALVLLAPAAWVAVSLWRRRAAPAGSAISLPVDAPGAPPPLPDPLPRLAPGAREDHADERQPRRSPEAGEADAYPLRPREAGKKVGEKVDSNPPRPREAGKRVGEKVDSNPPRPREAGERVGERGVSASRWIPRPLWLFVPIALYVVVVAGAALLHGVNTPTHTDDAVRVRAFAPMLAFADGWSADARNIFVMAGALPTFVPSLAWIVTGTLDHFHVNYWVLTELVALLLLAVSLGSWRGDPERGWASAFAILSVPLFVYHCTSTYSDAVLAMRVSGGLIFAIEYGRTHDRSDAVRALLLFGLATLVKREGELVAAAPAAALLAQLAWERRGGGAFPWRTLAALAVPVVLAVLGKIAAVGLGGAFPMLGLVAQRSAAASDTAARAPGTLRAAAEIFFGRALFRSGNAGMIYWVLAATVAVRARALVRSGLAWTLAAVALLLVEVAVSSILLVPQYTLDQSTVHRALLVASVPAALWLAAAITGAAREEAVTEDSAKAAEPALVITRRRRPRPASRS